jgi:hypothetical protein
MKHLYLVALLACAVLFVSCQSTKTAGARGNQEAKRMAALEQERAEEEKTDEAQRNLWNAQHDILTRDGNAASHYY